MKILYYTLVVFVLMVSMSCSKNRYEVVVNTSVVQIFSEPVLKDFDKETSIKGNSWDNAVAESFFKTIKYEMINHYKFKSTEDLKAAVFHYIENWYNRKRLHSALRYKSPAQREYELNLKYKYVA